MGISFGSINTGLPKDIVQQIMAAERVPIQKMETRKIKINEKMELLNQLTKLVEDLRGQLHGISSYDELRELKVETNNDLIDVTVDKYTAEPGITQMEVMRMAQRSSAITNAVADKNESYFGVGFLQYTMPNGTEKEIFIDSQHSSLSGIAQLINSDPTNGMTATVVNDGQGIHNAWRMIIALDESGDNQRAEFPYFYMVDGREDLYLDQERGAHDSQVKVNGFMLEADTNKIQDFIPGVTVDLKKAKPGEEFSIKITEDTAAIAEKIKNMIEKINEVLKFIKEQNNLNETSDTSRTLGGDLTLQSLESRLRTLVFKNIDTTYHLKRIGDLGITFQRSGLLEFNEDKFKSLLSKNVRAVLQVLVGRTSSNGSTRLKGFNNFLNDLASNVLRTPNGLLRSRKNGLKSNIEQIDKQIENRERLLAQKEQALKNKFARLEETISRIKGSGAGLSALGAPAQNQINQLM